MVDPEVFGDGVSERDEINAGTNPLLNGSFLRITRLTRELVTGAITLEWPTVPDRLYRVLRSATLNLEHYEVISPEIPGTGEAVSFTGSEPWLAPKVFYWVECLRGS